MNNYPKIKSVKPLVDYKLLITFNNTKKKIYDCIPLIEQDIFRPLSNLALFNTVKADRSGYGISWNDELDLSESELWLNGVTVEQDAAVDPTPQN